MIRNACHALGENMTAGIIPLPYTFRKDIVLLIPVLLLHDHSDLDGLALPGRVVRDDAAFELLAVDDQFLHALLAAILLNRDFVIDAAVLTMDREVAEVMRYAGVDLQAREGQLFLPWPKNFASRPATIWE